MQNSIRTLVHEKTKRTAILFHIMTAVIVLTELVMYYAAGLFLNMLFAGIGNMAVTLIIFLAAGGAMLGKFLFTLIRNQKKTEIKEISLETLEESVLEKDTEEYDDSLHSLFLDAVHFETEGMLGARTLFIEDIIRIVAVFLLDVRCGLVTLGAVAVYDFAVYKLSHLNVKSEKSFVTKLSAMSGFLNLSAAVILLSGMVLLDKQSLGLYGLIMIMFIWMDILSHHEKQNREILRLRRDLHSLEKIEAYKPEEESQIAGIRKAEEKADLKAALMRSSSLIFLSLSFVLCAYGIRNILSYRTLISLNAIKILIPLCALGASFFYICSRRAEAGKERKETEHASGMAVSALQLVLALVINPLHAGIYASSLATLYVLLPLLLREKEEDSSDHFYGLLQYLFLILILFSGMVLYWNTKESFPEVLMIAVLYMLTCMNMNTKPVMKKAEGEDYE